MAGKRIQNCKVRFRFQCPMQWDALQETGEAGVRSCSQCQKRVYLCQSTEEITQLARQGHCIAVPRWWWWPRERFRRPSTGPAWTRTTCCWGSPSTASRSRVWARSSDRLGRRGKVPRHATYM